MRFILALVVLLNLPKTLKLISDPDVLFSKFLGVTTEMLVFAVLLTVVVGSIFVLLSGKESRVEKKNASFTELALLWGATVTFLVHSHEDAARAIEIVTVISDFTIIGIDHLMIYGAAGFALCFAAYHNAWNAILAFSTTVLVIILFVYSVESAERIAYLATFVSIGTTLLATLGTIAFFKLRNEAQPV